MARDVARVSPLALLASQQVRLRRLARDAVYKEDQQLLVAPVRGTGVVDRLVGLLRELVPTEDSALVS